MAEEVNPAPHGRGPFPRGRGSGRSWGLPRENPGVQPGQDSAQQDETHRQHHGDEGLSVRVVEEGRGRHFSTRFRIA
jgi:hypothetical protein